MSNTIVAELPTTVAPRLIDKAELLRRIPVSFPTIWKMMREGKFPNSRLAGGKAMWFENEVDDWIRSLPPKKLKPADAQQQNAARARAAKTRMRAKAGA